MASYQDYYKGIVKPIVPPARQKPPAAVAPAPIFPALQPGERQPGPPIVPAPLQRRPSSHFFLRNANAQPANPFAAMFGSMGGGTPTPGYGYQAPQMPYGNAGPSNLGYQYGAGQAGGYPGGMRDTGPRSLPNTLPDGRIRLSTGEYVNPSDRPAMTIGMPTRPDGYQSGMQMSRAGVSPIPFAYGAPQSPGNPYLPRF